MSRERQHFISRREAAYAVGGLVAGVALTAAVVAGAARSQDKPNSPKSLSLQWDRKVFEAETFDGVLFEGNDRNQEFTKIGIVGAVDTQFQALLRKGGQAAIAYTDPGGKWHVGVVPQGREFAVVKDKEVTYRAAALLVGREATRFTFGSLQNDTFVPVQTEKLGETTEAALPHDTRFGHLPFS